LTVSEWADRYRRLSPESSAEPGQWRTDRAEYLRGIMDAVSDPAVHTVVVMSSAQVGKTEICLNIVGFHIDQDAAPLLLMQPTLEMAESFSKDRLAPMLRDTPALCEKVKDPRARDSGNTLLHKTFPGGRITMVGANSAAGLASRPIRIVLADEIDRYPASAGTEGDPVNLALKRTTTFWNRKAILVSTPGIKGESRIEHAFMQSDMRRFWVPCPHCGALQVLNWANVKWDNSLAKELQAASAWYACSVCEAAWTDQERWAAIRRGQWQSSQGFTGIAGFHLNELYSSWVKLSETVANFMAAKELPETLKTWVNTALGESFEEQGQSTDMDDLLARREIYNAEVPAGVAVLTAGVDVQDDRVEVEIVGWGRDEESWSIDHVILPGDPFSVELWQELDALLLKKFRHENGHLLPIKAAAVDSGHATQHVYQFCKERFGRRVWAIKGQGGAGKPIPVWPKNPRHNNKAKVPLYSIGVDAAKGAIFARLNKRELGAGYCHFPEDRDEAYFRQLTSEYAVTRYSHGRPYQVYVKRRGVRNEALDLRVYAYAALQGLMAMGLKLNRESDRIPEATPQPDGATAVGHNGGEDNPPPPPPPPPPNYPPRPRRQPVARKTGFVNSWRY
jgi:phage terminase large subunit GpA-like protein